jgi:hypothetical protein
VRAGLSKLIGLGVSGGGHSTPEIRIVGRRRVRTGGAFPLTRFLTAVPARAPNYVTITSGGDVTGLDLTPVGRGMPRTPVPFFGCGGTPHGRGSSAE